MMPNEIYGLLRARFAEAIVRFEEGMPGDPYVVVEPTRLLEIARFLKEEPRLHFDFLRCVTAVDYPQENLIRVTYHLLSLNAQHGCQVKVELNRENPAVETVESIWPAANWHEREQYDLVGVQFINHGDLRRLMLPPDWEGHPLRKDFTEQANYHGISTSRANPLDLFDETTEASNGA